jgi:rubrerythrin
VDVDIEEAQVREELQERLKKKYPTILRDTDKPATVSCMAFGLAVGDGWYALLDKLMADIMAQPSGDEVVALQIKEKFGGLRFYYNHGTEEIHKLIDKAENDSYHICEECGLVSEEPLTTHNGHGWIVTLCANHYEERYGQQKEPEDV